MNIINKVIDLQTKCEIIILRAVSIDSLQAFLTEFYE